MKKRTQIDWSKHELTVIEHLEADLTVHRFKNPACWSYMVEFINVRGILVVKGDLGNWVFCRPFLPSAESDFACGGYWKEKLQISSCQEPSKYSAEYTAEALREQIAGLDDAYNSEKRKEEARRYYEDCLEAVDDEYEYIQVARDYPSFMDSESIIFEKKVSVQFEAVLDAYDEIVRRLKEEAKLKAA